MKKKSIFSEEAIKNFAKLGTVLRQIHSRLAIEGKVRVVNGKVIFLDSKPKDKNTTEINKD